MNTIVISNKLVSAYMPTKEDIFNITVNSMAPDCFGKMAKVTRVHGAGIDINGKHYVCYYTEFGANGSISNSLKEDTILRTVAMSCAFTSHEIDCFERNANH